MANELRELQLQGDSTVYKLNDARITTTAVTTATHILTTNSGVTSIAPITAANLASVLGVPSYTEVDIASYIDASAISALLSSYEQTGGFSICSGVTSSGSECAWYGMKHGSVGELLVWCRSGILCVYITNPNTITKTYSIVTF